MKQITGILLLAVLALPAAAQQLQDFEVNYNNGKVLLQQKRFEQAMKELRPVTAAAKGNDLAPEASYLYALAAFRANNQQEALLMLGQLKQQHPQWAGMPDANYLLANIQFEQKEPDQALATLGQVKAPALSEDVDRLKRHYLNRIADREAYEQLLQKYASDKTVAQVYADKLLAGWYRPQDKPTLERLVAKFNLDRKRYLNPEALRKKAYQVAVLLPFQLNQDLAQSARKNQFVTDLYAGMKLAQDSLQKQGINIELFAYDAGADTVGVKRLLEQPELKQMDLVIGPVYKSTAKVALRFAAENNVTVINPLSQDTDVAGNSHQVLLFESSVATQAQQAATYAYHTFSPKTAVIVFEGSTSDTTFARHYRQQFQKLGGRILAYRKINSAQSAATAGVFKELTVAGVGHLAVFSERMTAAANAISLLNSQPSKLPLITYDKWLDINQITLRELDDQEVYFISPKYFDQTSPAVRNFRKRYTARYNIPPSTYAYSGFEMLYYFGSMLQEYGPDFNQSLPLAGTKRGVLYQGVGYSNAAARNEFRNDNQYVPITKLENMQLMVVNPAGF
ncbi:ABC transporter substrate-binding protein [Pontibacter beigongshangensis]|uniref:ABC transporter substrate-binding protein n=1 Tax=Pontibacter beigongshangensis TaxID=2574733 RepID=UPI001F50FC22|nr:ABC transporter substrate-binding protein [Pontibacter beigongshangensis]